MAKTNVPSLEDELNKLQDEFTNPRIIKSLIFKGYVAHTTEPSFKELKTSEEELTQTRVSMYRIIDFLDALIERQEK